MQISWANNTSDSDKWVTSAVQTGAVQSATVSIDNAMATEDKTNTAITGVAASSKSEVSKSTTDKPKVKEDKSAEDVNTTLSFKVHKATGEVMVRIIDNTTGEVVREIPPEKILDSIAEIWKDAGINVDKKV